MMKTSIIKLETLNKIFWLFALVSSLATLIYALISHYAYFGTTSMNIIGFLQQSSPGNPLLFKAIKADILVQWPSLLLLHLLPKDDSYGIVMFLMEFGYIFQGVIAVGLLYFLTRKYNRKTLQPILLFTYVIVFSSASMLSSTVMLPLTVFIIAFYLMLIRHKDDSFLAITSLLLGLLLVFQPQHLLVLFVLLIIAAWYRYKESKAKKDKFILIGTCLNFLILVLKVIIFHTQNLIDFNWHDEIYFQLTLLIMSSLYLVPAVYAMLPKSTDQEKMGNSLLTIWLLMGSFMLVAFSGAILREYLDDKIIALPLIIFSIVSSVLIFLKKRINPLLHGFLFAIALISCSLFVQIEPINFVRGFLLSAWNKIIPRSYTQVLALISLFMLQFFIFKEKLKKINKVLIIFATLVVLSGIYRVKILYNLNIPLVGTFNDQGIYIVLTFLMCVTTLLIERDKYQIKIFSNSIKSIAWILPVILILNGVYSTMKLIDWNWGVQNIKIGQANKSGCFIIPKGLEQQQLTAIGITKDFIPMQSMLFTPSRIKNSVVFFQDPSDTKFSPCEVRTWGNEFPYFGYETWGGEEASWMLIKLRSRYLDFSSLAGQ